MIKKILLILVFLTSLNAEDNLIVERQNTLYVQNLIELEEKIAKMLEKYLLTEFKIPTLDDLKTDSYLGSNFSLDNRMSSNIAFEDINNLKIKYAITNNDYRINDRYLIDLYNRDLYRDYTTAYNDVDITKSFVQIVFQSNEVKTIFNLLKAGNTIAKTCTSALVNTYCNNNQRTIRWYNASSQWIEYDKINFNNGNVTVSSSSLLTNTKLNDLAVGSYIFVENLSKYIKLVNDSSGNLQILKVD